MTETTCGLNYLAFCRVSWLTPESKPLISQLMLKLRLESKFLHFHVSFLSTATQLPLLFGKIDTAPFTEVQRPMLFYLAWRFLVST